MAMKSDLNLLQWTTPSTSRHVTLDLVTSHHALGRCSVSTSLVRVDVVDVADTSSRHRVNIMNEHLPEINRLD